MINVIGSLSRYLRGNSEKIRNSTEADEILEKAREMKRNGQHKEAKRLYKKVIEYYKRWRDYEPIPRLEMEMGSKIRAMIHYKRIIRRYERGYVFWYAAGAAREAGLEEKAREIEWKAFRYYLEIGDLYEAAHYVINLGLEEERDWGEIAKNLEPIRGYLKKGVIKFNKYL